MADNRIRFIFEINDAGKAKVQGLTKDFVSLDNAINKVNTDLKRQASEMNKTGKSTKNMVDKTGLAGATLVELSRTISDSNYGFTAMANNISQLSTLFITLLATTGGLGNGLKELKKAFMGPLGFIVLFNVAVAAIEKMAMKAKTTKKEVDALRGAFTDTAGDLQTFVELIDRGNISNRDLDEALIALKKTYPGLNIQIDENRRLTKESRLEIDKKIKKLRELAKTQAFQKELEKIYAKEVRLELDTAETIKNIREEASSNLLTGATFVSEASRDIQAEEKKGREARIVTLEKERDDELAILKKRKEGILAMAEDMGAAAGLLGGKDDPFMAVGKITKQVMDSIFPPEEEKTPGQKFAEDILNGYDAVELGAKKHTLSMEEINFRLALIDAERLDHFASATDALAGLFGERTAAGKAFAVATATIDAYSAGNAVLKDPYFIARPYERFAAMTAIVATGLANVKNILAVDESGQTTSAGTAGAGSSQAPVFNVVGQSNVDQLGRAISGARNEPLKAYVVGSEVSNQQDLDNKIIQSATLG